MSVLWWIFVGNALPRSAGVQREAKGGNGRTDQASGVWVECQGSNRLCQHVKVAVTQTRETAGSCSKIDVGEGAGGNEVG